MTNDAQTPADAVPTDIEVWIIDPSQDQFDESEQLDRADDESEWSAPDTAPEVERQSLFRKRPGGVSRVDSAAFLESWQQNFKTIQSIFDADAAQADKGKAFALDSVTAKLSISAKGKVAFIGELGGEVSFEACFKRR